MDFNAFGKQNDFLSDEHRIKGAFAGKRGGKTEVGAVQGLIYQEQRPTYVRQGVDPYLGIIAAPTYDMLKRLSWKKFMAYAKPWIKHDTKTPLEIQWHDHDPENQEESLIYGISADKPARLEGVKANWIWIDEVFQVSEQFFLECLARVSDQQGFVFCTGSLGVQFVNPKLHWAHKYFKEMPDEDTACYEWCTSDNPYFPQSEIEKLKNKLDPQTFRAMFELNWDITPSTAVYNEFNDDNVMDIAYNPDLPTYVSIDWGWAHPAAVGFFQYDEKKDIAYMIDEIVGSKIKIDELYEKIMSKPYKISGWYCDIAGDQEREQLGISNVQWFKKKGIKLKFRRSGVQYGISIVRSYIKNTLGKRRFFIAPRCVKSNDGVKQYRYKEKDGMILNENPLKENDDAVDMIRYFFVNHLDDSLKNGPRVTMVGR
jgi:phage terminase large subunit